MTIKKLNWFALIGGILLLVLIPISMYVSWWKLSVGDGLLTVNASPVNTSFNVLGTQLSSGIIWAVNITSILVFLSCGIIMLIYSIIPTKPYAKDLLGYAYRKPLYMVILYLAGLLVTMFATQAALGIGVPLAGSSTITLPVSLTMGADISVMVSSTFQWPFWLAIATAALSITARIYHPKLSSPKQTLQPTLNVNVTPNAVTTNATRQK
jgi:uncharacterized integral membrane protein